MRPMTLCFWPSKSMAERRTMRSETFLVEVGRQMGDWVRKEREGRRVWDWVSLRRFDNAIVVGEKCCGLIWERKMSEIGIVMIRDFTDGLAQSHGSGFWLPQPVLIIN